MGWNQIIFGAALVAVLLFLSLFYAWRQAQALRRLRQNPYLPDEETDYQRRQARRRLVGSGLMLALAVLLGATLVYLEARAQRLADEVRAAESAGQVVALSPEQKEFVRFYGASWIVILLTLMAVLVLAGVDLWATRRYGLRQYRKLQADRRAMIERQVLRLRQERNGHG